MNKIQVFNRAQRVEATKSRNDDIRERENQRDSQRGIKKRYKWNRARGSHPAIEEAAKALLRFTSNPEGHFHSDIELESYIPDSVRDELVVRLATWTSDSDLMQWLLDPPITFEQDAQTEWLLLSPEQYIFLTPEADRNPELISQLHEMWTFEAWTRNRQFLRGLAQRQGLALPRQGLYTNRPNSYFRQFIAHFLAIIDDLE